MELISPMSTMIKNVTLIKIVTYSTQICLVLISACHSPRRIIGHAKRDVCGVSLLLPLALLDWLTCILMNGYRIRTTVRQVCQWITARVGVSVAH